MTKQQIVLLLSVVFLFGALGTGIYFLKDRFFDSEKEKAAQKAAVDLPLASAASKNDRTVPLEETNDSDGLQVMGAGSGPRTDTSQLPLPDDFDVYEQFETAESTQYVDIRAGTGTEAASGDTISVVYSGWLTNGTLFDQTRKNEQGQLVAFTLTLGAGQVISGWEQGLVGMKQGGARRLIIPSRFGYGPSGQGDTIPPNAMLIFDVELVQVTKP